MEAVRQSWSDDRLDDLNRRIEDDFKRVDTRFDRVEARFDAIEDRLDARFRAMDGRFEAMQRLLIQVGGGMIAALCAALIGLIATQL